MQYFQAHIDSGTLNLLPKVTFGGSITVVDTPEQATIAVNELLKCEVLGFDTETRPIFRKGKIHKPALLQLACRDQAYLFRLHSTDMPPKLIELLESDSIKKVGAAVHDDLKALVKIKSFEPAGFVDLQNMATEYGIEEKSVRKLAAVTLGVKISKSQRLSNWEARELTVNQRIYAAVDAWICREIYMKLIQFRQNRFALEKAFE